MKLLLDAGADVNTKVQKLHDLPSHLLLLLSYRVALHCFVYSMDTRRCAAQQSAGTSRLYNCCWLRVQTRYDCMLTV